MYQPDYTSSNYQQYPFPHHHQQPPPTTTFPTTDPPPPPSYASAPPFSTVDYTSSFPHNYPPSFPHTSGPDPLSPTAPPPQPPSIGPGPESHGLYSSPPAQYPPSSNSTPYYPPPSPYQSYQTPTYPNSNPNYDNSPNYEYGSSGSGYFDENLSGYGGGNYGYNNNNNYEEDGVYAYQGKSEPYGAHGTGSKSSNWSGLFDDYGRPISFPSEDSFKEKDKDNSSSFKVVKAVPKAESNSDVQSGVQKFRVKLLPESGGSVMDVLCMVGLDGIRMLDPNTNRTLRIYPLETVTRCDKYDSSTVAFWSKTAVDVEPRRIRLQSNSYTTNTILDTMTAAIVQFKEMGGNSRPSEPPKALEQSADKKKGLTDWINKLKPVNEEKDHWVPDEAVSKCTGCGSDFNAFNRRHHCRNCGDVFCDKCTQGRTPLTAEDDAQAVRVCDRCMVHVTDRLSRAKEAATKSTSLQSHEDLAKKLQEEMEKNLRISSGSKSEVSGRQMREVACPTCTVHLQVQVPTSGSETIECGVCQHPFLVSAH